MRSRYPRAIECACIHSRWIRSARDLERKHRSSLRTIEAMYGLPKSSAQQPNAAGGGIADETIMTDVFEAVR